MGKEAADLTAANYVGLGNDVTKHGLGCLGLDKATVRSRDLAELRLKNYAHPCTSTRGAQQLKCGLDASTPS